MILQLLIATVFLEKGLENLVQLLHLGRRCIYFIEIGYGVLRRWGAFLLSDNCYGILFRESGNINCNDHDAILKAVTEDENCLLDKGDSFWIVQEEEEFQRRLDAKEYSLL